MSFWRDKEMDELEEELELECLCHEDQAGYPFTWDRQAFLKDEREYTKNINVFNDYVKLYHHCIKLREKLKKLEDNDGV